MHRREAVRILALVLCAAAALAWAAGAEAAGAEGTGTTTVMIYMIGSDLESRQSAATNDLDEILRCGVDPETTQVTVCAGGTNRWWNGLADPEAVTLLHLTADGFERNGMLPLQSMGEAACLAEFINRSVGQYPADRYALILWDHGNGPVMGYGKDLLFNQDGLTLAEMRQAMEQTPFAEGLKLEWVGFDACLMASAELACMWRDYAGYLVSSQETEPGFGWDYSFLKNCGSMPAGELVRNIADTYVQYAREDFARRENYDVEVTLSVVDLSRTEALERAVNALFRAAASDVSGDYIRLARARVDTRAVGRASTGSDYDLVDLREIGERMAADYPAESAGLLAALEDAVVYSVSLNAPECAGVSLFYPYHNKQYYRRSWKDAYRELGLFPEYLGYLERYEAIWLGTDMKRYFSGEMELQEGAAPSTYTMELTPEQAERYAAGNYYILRRIGEGLYSMIYLSDEVTLADGKLTAAFDGQIIYCETDYRQRVVPGLIRMWGTEDGITDYSVVSIVLGHFPDFVYLESASAEVRLSANRETGEVELRGIFSLEDEFSGGKREPLDPYDWELARFYYPKPRYLVRDENGKVPYFQDWPESDWIVWDDVAVRDHIRFTYSPLYDDGAEYFMVINVADIQGNTYSSELFPIRLPAAPEGGGNTDTVVWEEGTSVTLLERDGVTLRMTASAALNNGAPIWFITAENRNDFTACVQLGGSETVINGGSGRTGQEKTMQVKAGETVRFELEGLNRDAALSAEGRLRSLLFSCRIFRYDNYATLYRGQIRVEIPQAQEFAVQWEDALDAQAGEQTLAEADGVTVSLLHLGFPADTDNLDTGSLNASLCIENHSGAARETEVLGMRVNGVFLPCNDIPAMVLEDGQRWYPQAGIDLTSVRQLGNLTAFKTEEGGEALPAITSVNECSLCFRIGGRVYVRPVELSRKGAQGSVFPDGEVLYRDGSTEIRLCRTTAAMDYDGTELSVWYVWVSNIGGELLNLTYNAEKDGIWFNHFNSVIPPGCTVLMTVRAAAENGRDGISFTMESLTYNGAAAYRSEPVALPAR